eukprot:5408339-Pleurochrysis_carterae.AAC.1
MEWGEGGGEVGAEMGRTATSIEADEPSRDSAKREERQGSKARQERAKQAEEGAIRVRWAKKVT